jgi:hypothetical protein
MRTEQEIIERIRAITEDERMRYKTATIEINAPLALIQLEGESTVNALKWALGLIDECACSFRKGGAR